MSKRFIFPQQTSHRKKARLDISVSDHNFPLSQNAGSNNAPGQTDEWGDEIDDEILLQASQACEQACNVSTLPEYSQFKPPALTSTQLPRESLPSTSRGAFTFTKPATGSVTTISTHLRDKCNRISSPLRGLRANVENETIDLTDNFSNEVVNTGDSDYVYRQLLKLKEENAKLKSENGKLLEKCVTKEGEASILRTQLKTQQVAVDNARLEKIKGQEEARMQWSEKLNSVNNQLAELQTQLDFKNLEVISMKEKCKMLESNKIKLTQITVGNEMARLNSSMAVANSFMPSQTRRPKTASITVQTDSHPKFLKLSKPCVLRKSKLTGILPLIMDSTTDQQHSILDYNEKLKTPNDLSPNKCNIFSTIHRLSSGTSYFSNKSENKINISCIYEDLSTISASNDDVDRCPDQYLHIFSVTKAVLEKVQCQLEIISRRQTSAFQKEMDKLYMEATDTHIVVRDQDLITGKALFKDEQSILARRMTAILRYVLSNARAVHFFNKSQRPTHQASTSSGGTNEFVDLLCRICTLLDNNSCGLLYSGLLLAIILLIETLTTHSQLDSNSLLEIVKRVICSRPLGFVACRLLSVLCGARVDWPGALCNQGNLKVDYDQGVLMFKKDSCVLEVLLRQMEAALKCIERASASEAAEATRLLLRLHGCAAPRDLEAHRCKCGNILAQVLVYALRICSTMLDTSSEQTGSQSPGRRELLSVCRGGLQAVHQMALREPELGPQLGPGEGHLLEFCDRLRRFDHNEFYSTMLSEMTASFQAAVEDAPPSFHRQARARSFDTFTLAD